MVALPATILLLSLAPPPLSIPVHGSVVITRHDGLFLLLLLLLTRHPLSPSYTFVPPSLPPSCPTPVSMIVTPCETLIRQVVARRVVNQRETEARQHARASVLSSRVTGVIRALVPRKCYRPGWSVAGFGRFQRSSRSLSANRARLTRGSVIFVTIAEVR